MESRLNCFFSCVHIRPNEWSPLVSGQHPKGEGTFRGVFAPVVCSGRNQSMSLADSWFHYTQAKRETNQKNQKKTNESCHPFTGSHITHFYFFFCGQRNESLFFFRDVSHYSKMDQQKLNLLIIAAIIRAIYQAKMTAKWHL